MALRVLLADESSTIKKVFQLALQDFAVDVRTVNLGVDVSSVATNFKPDIIFADVLLQKKNGYDVCAELKQDPSLSSIPIVLMWSGFMELDEDKFQASHANAQLEKPFDVAALRKLVSDLVPRTQNQRLSQFLTFPKATAEASEAPMDLGSGGTNPSLVPEHREDFTAVPIPKMKGGGGNADKYRLNLKPEDLDPQHIPVNYQIPPEKGEEILETDDEEFTVRERRRANPKEVPSPFQESALQSKEIDIDQDPDAEDLVVSEELAAAPKRGGEHATPPPAPGPIGQLSAQQLEKIIREQSAEVIESVVWKVIPEIATQIIERELNRLLKERDSQPY